MRAVLLIQRRQGRLLIVLPLLQERETEGEVAGHGRLMR